MEYRLTDREKDCVERLLKSSQATRETLLAGGTPDQKSLYELINRADELIWHLAKRDTPPDEIVKMLADIN